MKNVPIKALGTFTAFTGEMQVFNKGDKGELPEDVAIEYINAGLAAKSTAGASVDESAATNVTAPKSNKKVSADPELGDARKRYRAVFGKNPGPKWSVEKINQVIADNQSDDDAQTGEDGSGGEGAPAE